MTTLHFSLAPLLADVGSGRIQGGWEYVWAGYGITWAGLLLYGVNLWLRRRSSTTPS